MSISPPTDFAPDTGPYVKRTSEEEASSTTKMDPWLILINII
jgi:hypothetical protein